MIKQIKKYFEKHSYYNSAVYLLIGVGIGILLNPSTGTHPIRWAGVLILVGLAGHLYPVWKK